MTSLISWLDHDENDRRRMREVIDLFREQDTLDELGIGVVRDTLANLLFPGTTTVQTRARYFLFLPWIYEEVERRGYSGQQAAQDAKKLEIKLIYALEKGGQRGSQGVIGWEARENLQRFPSVIYWSGLGKYGIRTRSGSLDEYFRSLGSYKARRDAHRAGDGDEVHERFVGNWHTGLPSPPDGFLDSTTLALRVEDAEFLTERIVTSAPESLLAFFLRTGSGVTRAVFPWEVPGLDDASAELKRYINHARRFSLVIRSAPLVYNLMLAERASSRGMSGRYAEWQAKHADELEEWIEAIDDPVDGVVGWDLDDFWDLIGEHHPTVRHPTRLFIQNWLSLAQRDPSEIVDVTDSIRQTIKLRERQLKGSQARLDSARALERWNGESGTRQLDYRWRVSQAMILDIRDGLNNASS